MYDLEKTRKAAGGIPPGCQRDFYMGDGLGRQTIRRGGTGAGEGNYF